RIPALGCRRIAQALRAYRVAVARGRRLADRARVRAGRVDPALDERAQVVRRGDREAAPASGRGSVGGDSGARNSPPPSGTRSNALFAVSYSARGGTGASGTSPLTIARCRMTGSVTAAGGSGVRFWARRTTAPAATSSTARRQECADGSSMRSGLEGKGQAGGRAAPLRPDRRNARDPPHRLTARRGAVARPPGGSIDFRPPCPAPAQP